MPIGGFVPGEPTPRDEDCNELSVRTGVGGTGPPAHTPSPWVAQRESHPQSCLGVRDLSPAFITGSLPTLEAWGGQVARQADRRSTRDRGCQRSALDRPDVCLGLARHKGVADPREEASRSAARRRNLMLHTLIRPPRSRRPNLLRRRGCPPTAGHHHVCLPVQERPRKSLRYSPAGALRPPLPPTDTRPSTQLDRRRPKSQVSGGGRCQPE
jgi:hypothetical protein